MFHTCSAFLRTILRSLFVQITRFAPKYQQAELQRKGHRGQNCNPATGVFRKFAICSLSKDFVSGDTGEATNRSVSPQRSNMNTIDTILAADSPAAIADLGIGEQTTSAAVPRNFQEDQAYSLLSKAQRKAYRRSKETQVEQEQRLAANAARKASWKSNETEEERKLRLSSDAQRTRLKRLTENDQDRADRLANDAERARKRRAVKVKEVVPKHASSQEESVTTVSHEEVDHRRSRKRMQLEDSEGTELPTTSGAHLIASETMNDSSEPHSLDTISEYIEESTNGFGLLQNTRKDLTAFVDQLPTVHNIVQQDFTEEESTALRASASSELTATPLMETTNQILRGMEICSADTYQNDYDLSNQGRRVTEQHEEFEVQSTSQNAAIMEQSSLSFLPESSSGMDTTRYRSSVQDSSVQNPEQRWQRTLPNLGMALTTIRTDENYLGPLNVKCDHCAALFFSCEAKTINGRVNSCCNFGNISLNPFSEFPEFFRTLYTETSALARNFRQHIRSYNSALAMASMGAQVDVPRGSGPYCYRIHGQVYHFVGPLTPEQGVRPQFGQVYILDTDTAAAERSGNPANAQCNPIVMQQLTTWLHSHNSYAASLKMMGDVATEEEQRAFAENRQVPTIRMVFEDPSNLDRRRYNIPASNEIAVVYVGEDNDVPPTRSFAIHHRRSGLQVIRDIDGRCDPLTYPLIFPRGGLGWHVDLKKNPSNRIRTRITQREYYSNLLAVRHSFNPLHHAGKLMQQFAVDAYVKIEQNRLNYTRTHQKELRVDSYRGLMDHLAGDNADGPPGQRVILPSSFPGSPRAMQQSYQDAMSIVARYGKPDYFLTFTCNPKWREITENLYPGQSPSDRPDLVARVFNQKLRVLQNHLYQKKILGSVAAHVGIVEWQKRGLPHCHMLLIMSASAKPRNSADVDAAVQAYIPSASENPRLLSIVARNMIHRQCGMMNPTAPCMVKGQCTKRYPKDFRESTDVDVDGYPKYRRPDDGRTITSGGEVYDNRHVVPYNSYLLQLLNAHINLEICGYIQAVKYLYKYVYKGPDRASLRLSQQDRTQHSDEIRAHLDARYVCSPEALHHIFMYDCQFKSDTVCRLAVHLPDFQTVTFQSGEEREAAAREAARDSMLTAWFKLNNEYELMESDNIDLSGMVDPRTLHYHQLPEHFTFVQQARKWKKKERGNRQIGRMHTVPPNDPEIFSLRILLLHRKNMRSFEDLRTVDGQLHPTFLDAVRSLGLLRDDSNYESCLEEAALFRMPAELRALFSYMLAYCDISEPQHLYDRFKSEMAEDFVHRGSTPTDAEALTYFDLYDRLQSLRYDLSVRIIPPAQRPVLPDQTDYSYHEQKGREMYQLLNQQQKSAADNILASSNPDKPKLHFVDGPGGSGKTFLYNALYHILKGGHKKVLCVAWTGIAASLLPEGRTASSTFKLNMKTANRECTLRREAKEASPLKEADAIIWDEISMVSRFSLEAVNLLLQDLMCNKKPFGGKTIVLGGDFRQVLPIVERGGESDMIDACVKNSQIWSAFQMHRLSVNMRAVESGSSWCDFLMHVGNGDAEEDEMGRISLPAEIISNGDLIDEVFGDQLTDFDTLSERAILTPRNLEAYRINEEVLNRLPGQVHEYKSADDIVSDDQQTNEYTTEFLNSLTPAGLPPHKLRMKEGSIIMLLRNLDVQKGLCNGTRLIVTHFKRFVLGCRFACGDRKGKFALIPRIDNYTDAGVPFRLRRTQFPVRLSFAMTINKAQGQSLTNVGILLETEVFSHGQLYVALSRARRREGVKVHKKEDRVKNVVIKAVLT